ncbi:MAG: transcription antitermination factor NusB [Bacteroidetes bacterium]|nr:MAG: transcription antitermination factor NusB [Bacteroidota bacterium]
MLSRRNIRVKVMQALYAMTRDPLMSLKDTEKLYLDLLDQSWDLYLFSLLFWQKVALWAHKDQEQRQAKLLPSEEDKQFKPLLGQNPLIDFVVQHDDFQRLVRQRRLVQKVDEDIVKKLYKDFSQTDGYLEYALGKKGDDIEVHREMLMNLYKWLIKQELFDSLLEDLFPVWIDDKSLVVGAMKKTIRSLPDDPDLHRTHKPPHDATHDFGLHLLRQVVERDRELLQTIKPTLKNWDIDRLAVLDMILLKMALAELLGCPTIPTKVTLNEYVEIAKLYSTDKSKDFVNGILDRLMKQLSEEGKIHKTGRGLMD